MNYPKIKSLVLSYWKTNGKNISKIELVMKMNHIEVIKMLNKMIGYTKYAKRKEVITCPNLFDKKPQ